MVLTEQHLLSNECFAQQAVGDKDESESENNSFGWSEEAQAKSEGDFKRKDGMKLEQFLFERWCLKY